MANRNNRSAGEREINPVPVLRAAQSVLHDIAIKAFFDKYKTHLTTEELLKSMLSAFNNHYQADVIDDRCIAEKAVSLGLISVDDADDYVDYVEDSNARWWFVNEFEKRLSAIDELASRIAYQYQFYV